MSVIVATLVFQAQPEEKLAVPLTKFRPPTLVGIFSSTLVILLLNSLALAVMLFSAVVTRPLNVLKSVCETLALRPVVNELIELVCDVIVLPCDVTCVLSCLRPLAV